VKDIGKYKGLDPELEKIVKNVLGLYALYKITAHLEYQNSINLSNDEEILAHYIIFHGTQNPMGYINSNGNLELYSNKKEITIFKIKKVYSDKLYCDKLIKYISLA
jgi:hypothetical protein